MLSVFQQAEYDTLTTKAFLEDTGEGKVKIGGGKMEEAICI